LLRLHTLYAVSRAAASAYGLAVELFKTGRIARRARTPNPSRAIERCELAHDAVTVEIERLLGEIENAYRKTLDLEFLMSLFAPMPGAPSALTDRASSPSQ